jgi:hypothetical protein
VHKLCNKNANELSEYKSSNILTLELSFDESADDSQHHSFSKRDLSDSVQTGVLGLSYHSQKNFPPKAKVCRDDSAILQQGTNLLNITGFSNFFPDNQLIKYYEYGTKNSTSPEKEPSPIKKINNNHSHHNANESINNTYLNMNVNMNVLNTPSPSYFMPNIPFTGNQNNVTPLSKNFKFNNMSGGMPMNTNTMPPMNNYNMYQHEQQEDYDDDEGYPEQEEGYDPFCSPYEQNMHRQYQGGYGGFNQNMPQYPTGRSGGRQMPMNPNHMFTHPNNSFNMMRPGQMDMSGMKNNQKQSFLEFDDTELARYAYNLAKDQAGCRYLQKRIDDNPDIVNNLIFPNVIVILKLDNRKHYRPYKRCFWKLFNSEDF